MGALSHLARHKTAVRLCLLLVPASDPAAQTDGGHSRSRCEGIATVTAPSLAPDLVAEGFTLPVHLAAPPHDVNRLFVVEQDGAIKIIKSGRTLPQPFPDIRDRVRSSGERGLLSIAFHTDYASNRRFFVYYTEATGDLVIAEFASSATDPDVADPGSERRLLVIPHRKYDNHNGGQLFFGPDRYLYIGTGDGGGGGDPDNNAQTKRSLLGKLLRIDVEDRKSVV